MEEAIYILSFLHPGSSIHRVYMGGIGYEFSSILTQAKNVPINKTFPFTTTKPAQATKLTRTQATQLISLLKSKGWKDPLLKNASMLQNEVTTRAQKALHSTRQPVADKKVRPRVPVNVLSKKSNVSARGTIMKTKGGVEKRRKRGCCR